MTWRTTLLITGVGVCFAGITACGPKQVAGSDPIATTTTTQSASTSVGTGAAKVSSTPAQPFTTPSTYKDKSWTLDQSPDGGVFSTLVKVPQGWAETKRETYWSDFLDPSGQVRLRVDVKSGLTSEGLEQSTAKAAADELARLRGAEGFKLLGQRTVAPGGQSGMGGSELVYQFTRDGQAVQCTYRFLGTEDITQARMGIYYPASEQRGAEDVLNTVQTSLLLTD